HDRRIERSWEVTVFLSAPNETSLRGMNGDVLVSPPLRDALDHGLSSIRLDRPEAAQLGLPARTAVAGLAHVAADELGRWGVAAVASAGRERDREKRARWRLVLSVVVASGLVLVFGGMALRKQRKELGLARELAISEVQRTADEGLARAQRLATMGTFAMGIAHEVATPLGVIMGRSEQMIARPEGDGRTARSARVISEQADRIEHIVRRFLDMARGGPPTLERADPGDVARAAAVAVEHRFAKAGVALKRSIPAGMPAIQCERALLEQAIVNLLLNACEACGEGGHVEVSALSGGERVEFVVTDDGVGISAEDAKRATEPFFTTKASRGGSGLGLAIATEIAKIHRGALSIGPDSEGRTRACIEVPAAAADPPLPI
ncbi:MAG: sensor histidine kinase, partial [Polyangiaceae bacterium]